MPLTSKQEQRQYLRRVRQVCGKLVYTTGLGQLVEYHYVTAKQPPGMPVVEVVRKLERHVCIMRRGA
jgi:hypothetical protein